MSAVMRSVVGGVAVSQLVSLASWFAPAGRAAWSWQCTVFTDSSSVKYIDPGASTGVTCGDGSSLTCGCSGTPCAGTNYSILSNLTCAGAGNDAATNGCLKLHHSYGNIPPLGPVLAAGGTACATPSILKVFGNAAGLQMMADWGLLNASQVDNSTTPATAGECQTLCSQFSGCKYFTFNDGGLSGGGYAYFRGLCFLLDAIACSTPYAEYPGVVSGPATCPSASTPTPTPTPTPPKSNATSADGAVPTPTPTPMPTPPKSNATSADGAVPTPTPTPPKSNATSADGAVPTPTPTPPKSNATSADEAVPTPTPTPPQSNATSVDGAVHAFSAASAALTGIMALGLQS